MLAPSTSTDPVRVRLGLVDLGQLEAIGGYSTWGDFFGDLPGVFLGLEQNPTGTSPEPVTAFALCSSPMMASIFGSSYSLPPARLPNFPGQGSSTRCRLGSTSGTDVCPGQHWYDCSHPVGRFARAGAVVVNPTPGSLPQLNLCSTPALPQSRRWETMVNGDLPSDTYGSYRLVQSALWSLLRVRGKSMRRKRWY
jgi:hypothetical protein